MYPFIGMYMNPFRYESHQTRFHTGMNPSELNSFRVESLHILSHQLRNSSDLNKNFFSKEVIKTYFVLLSNPDAFSPFYF